MPYAISLWLTPHDEAPIRAIWSAIHSAGLSSFLSQGSYRPRITLAVYEQLDVAAAGLVLQPYFLGAPPFRVMLPSIGIFTNAGGDNTVFLSVTTTEELLALHGDCLRLLRRAGQAPGEHYRLSHWNPHISIARRVATNAVPDVVRFAQGIDLPMEVMVERVGIVEITKETELESYSLRRSS